DTRLERVATLIANSVDPETLKSVRQPVDIDGPAYAEIAAQMQQAITAGNLGWLGIYYREGDYFYYWVDQEFTGVGYPFFYATPEHFAAYEQQQPRRVQYTDEFGSYYGFTVPIIVNSENGPQTLGLVEAVVDLESRDLLQRAALSQIWPILLGGSIIAALLSLLITVIVVSRPLRLLQQGALALGNGQFGYVINLRARIKDELQDVADAFNQMSGQLERLYREQAERERIQRELEIARTVQQALFPATIPQVDGLEIAAFCRPHRETSGDFYDLLALGEGQLGVVVGDVSGKSIPAAMMMVAAQSTLRAEAFAHTSPAQVLDQSNVLLQRNMPRGMFVAASYARLDPQSSEMVWANAGQIYPVLLHRVRPADPQAYPRYLEATGAAFPLGLNAALNYDDQPLKLLPGDTVLFYTDGVIEAMNQAGELYGFERLEALVRSLAADLSPQALLEAILADVTAFVGAAEQHDDITMVAVKVIG
ncbi:MAG TPA: PP2C family protein-serine/threonine phosphatase, partial [Anaerolineae bacterium]|nr:PP2C family protein-serine/threonine phosphatase [Anaerolineae bacterium]